MEKNEGLFNVYFKADRVDYGKNGYESINLKNNPNLMSDSIFLFFFFFLYFFFFYYAVFFLLFL